MTSLNLTWNWVWILFTKYVKMKCLDLCFLLVLFESKAFLEYGRAEATDEYCLYKEEYHAKVKYGIPPVPDFLEHRRNTELCRKRLNDIEQIQCSGVFIIPNCICSFHHVSNRIYHNYTACPLNSKKDDLDHLTCEDCRKYSVNKTGPCLNGGTFICETEMLAIDITCLCPETFSGKFCENKIEPVYRICHSKPLLRLPELPNCSQDQTDECKVNINLTSFKCTTNITLDRRYQDCDPHSKYTTKDAIGSGRRVINCGNILQSASLTFILFSYFAVSHVFSYFHSDYYLL